MKEVLKIVEGARKDLRVQLIEAKQSGGLTEERYARYLSMQYHLTNGVQKHFFAAAAHPELASRKSLRKFLLNFGDEEESHYLIAKKDLENANLPLYPANLDVKLWWSYFNSIIEDRPFVRLGATCILENISVGNGDLIQDLVKGAAYLNPRNTRFLIIHQHEELPHGDQILDALSQGNLTPDHIKDLEEGAAIGRTMYLRLFAWVLNGKDTCGVGQT